MRHRSFQRQLVIWNEKVTGHRPLYSDNGTILNVRQLSERDLLYKILRWSALPGTSRHHWGTDIDVIDISSIPTNYQVKLIVDETQNGGIFSRLHQSLDVICDETFDFFRPYSSDSGGVAPEPWHLSYRPIAEKYRQILTKDILADFLVNQPILLKYTIIEELDEIFSRFVI